MIASICLICHLEIKSLVGIAPYRYASSYSGKDDLLY